MESFDQLIKLAHEAQDIYKKFLQENLDVSVDQAFMNYYKAKEVCKEIQDKLDRIEQVKEGCSGAYDKCVYYMAKESLASYQYSSLVVFTHKLAESLTQLVEKRAEEKQKVALKDLIKEAIKEARIEDQKVKPNKSKRTKLKFSKSIST